MLAASEIHTHPSTNPPPNAGGLPCVQRGLSTPPSTLTVQSALQQSTPTQGEAQAGAGLYTTASPLPPCTPTPGTAEPHSPPAPAPAREPLRHRPAGSPVLRCRALPRAPTEDPLSLSV